jgi:hypothetical protein
MPPTVSELELQDAASRVFTPFQARQYWKRLRASWCKTAKEIEADILAIEPLGLRHVVARIVSACAQNQGAYILEEGPEGFNVTEIELEDDVVDAILEGTGGETEPLDDAYDWIVNRLRGMPGPFVAWAFGELALREPVVNDNGEELAFFAHQRVIYSLAKRQILGISSQPDFLHPKNRIVAIRL